MVMFSRNRLIWGICHRKAIYSVDPERDSPTAYIYCGPDGIRRLGVGEQVAELRKNFRSVSVGARGWTQL